MERINFKDGTLKTPGYVVIDGKTYEIVEAEYEGDTPLSAYMMNKLQDNIETHTYQVTLTEKVLQNTDYTLPCNYIVGNDSLEIYVLGILFIKDEHYKEVGNSGEISNKIQFLDWDVSAGYTITIKVQGQAGGGTNG